MRRRVGLQGPLRYANVFTWQRFLKDNFRGAKFFARSLGSQPGQTVREICVALNKATQTPISFWIEMSPLEWEHWSDAIHKISKQSEKR